MERADYRARLIHILLREELGGQAPPDLRARIMAAATEQPTRWQRLRPALMAAAALLVAAVTLWWFVHYPVPRAAGDFRVIGGAEVARGATLRAGAGGATLELGGYCSIALAPHTRAVIEGTKRREILRLEHGEAICDVDAGRGEFTVVTKLGSVAVTGTEFVVQFNSGGEDMDPRRLFVKVLAGTVLLTGVYGRTEALAAGDEQIIVERREGRIVCAVQERNAEATMVRVRVLEVLAGDEELAGESIRLAARWVQNDDGGFTPYERDVAAFRELTQGDRIEVEYYTDERYRVRSLKILESAGGGGTIENGQPTYQERDHEPWRERGRIVGHLRNSPGARIEVLRGDDVVAVIEVRVGALAYETDMLRPGVYGLRVRAEGYEPLEVREIEVRARADVFVALEFTARGQDEQGEGGALGVPAALRGFRGMLQGTIVKKGEREFVLKLERVLRVWEGNDADHPGAAVGGQVVLEITDRSRMAGQHIEILRGLRAGDRVTADVAHFGGNSLIVLEDLRKVD